MRNLNDDTAVSEIIGTITMLLVATSIFIAVFTVVMSATTPPSDIFVNLVGSIQGDNVTIMHKGGESLSLDTIISVRVGDEQSQNYTVGDLLDINLQEGGWNIGEKIIISTAGINNNIVHVFVRDSELNKLLMDVEFNS